MSNETESHPVKSIAEQFRSITYSVSDSPYEVMEIFQLLELMTAGDSRCISDTERLHRLQSAIGGAARLTKVTAEKIDKIYEEMESFERTIRPLDSPQAEVVLESHDEAEFLKSYRTAKKKHKKIIRDLARKMSKTQANRQEIDDKSDPKEKLSQFSLMTGAAIIVARDTYVTADANYASLEELDRKLRRRQA